MPKKIAVVVLAEVGIGDRKEQRYVPFENEDLRTIVLTYDHTTINDFLQQMKSAFLALLETKRHLVASDEAIIATETVDYRSTEAFIAVPLGQYDDLSCYAVSPIKRTDPQTVVPGCIEGRLVVESVPMYGKRMHPWPCEEVRHVMHTNNLTGIVSRNNRNLFEFMDEGVQKLKDNAAA